MGGGGQAAHNVFARPKYVIDGPYNNEWYPDSYKEAIELRDEMVRNSISAYESYFHQKFQAKTYEWSAVCNIKEDTTMEDMQRLKDYFETTYGWQCYQIAIHRDEGHINDDGEKVINHHAHLEFITLDKNTGKKNFKLFDFPAQRMRKMQDDVAEILQMERGVDKRLSGAKRIEPRKYAIMKEKEREALREERKKQNKEQNQILDTLDSALNIDTSNAKSTKEAFNRHIQTIKDHTQELNDTKAQLTKAKQELDEVKQESFTITKQSKEEYESAIEKHKEMLLALANENKALKAELENERESRLTKAQVKAIIEQERKAWIKEQGHTKEEYAQLRALNKQSYTTIEELNAKIAELNANIKALKSHEMHILDTHEAKIAELESKLQSKESALITRSEQIKDFIADLQSKDKIIADLQKQNNDLQQNHSNLSHRYAKFQSNENVNTNIAQNTQNRFSQELEGKNDEKQESAIDKLMKQVELAEKETKERQNTPNSEFEKRIFHSKSTPRVDFGNVSTSKRR